ncbi:YhdP family protein [Geminicoccus roseus]|uniref:YhdP family protein n=1 Tax=Geminicoccus roseus TaxID=404900 RepID=UPI0004031B8E|nr:AsmA-like C-terminal domain-containing protein [Geminicoccus roseus]
MTAAPPGRKRPGRWHRLLRGVAAVVAVLVVLLTLTGFGAYQRLAQGPVSLQPLVPWLKAPVEQRLGMPVDIEGLQLAFADGQEDGLVLSAGPVTVSGDAPARAESLRFWMGLPFRMQAVQLSVDNTEARTLLAAWPTYLLPEVREQLLELIAGGRIRTGELHYRFHPDRDDDLTLRIQAEDAQVRLPDGLPEVAAKTAEVAMDGGDLQVRSPAATGAGLTVTDLAVTIDHLTDEQPSRLTLAGGVQGKGGALYDLLAHPPLALIPPDLVEAGSLRGQMNAKLDLALPLADDIPADSVDLRVDGSFSDVAGRLHLPVPLDLTKTAGGVKIADGAIELNAKGLLFGSPLSIALHDRWRNRGEGRRIELQGPVTGELLARFDVPVPEQVGGRAVVVAKLHEKPAGRWNVELDADLAEARIDEPVSGLSKAVGQPGRLSLSGQASDAASWAIERFALEAGDQKAEGSVAPAEAGHLMKLDRLVTATMDLSAALVLGSENSVRGRIEGKRAGLPDGAASAASAAGAAPAVGAGEPADPPTALALELDLERFDTGRGVLNQLQGHVEHGAQGFHDVRLGFDLGGPASLTIAPIQPASPQTLELLAPDAGRLIEVLGAGKAVTGGKLKLEAVLAQQVPAMQAKGRIDLSDTRINMSGEQPMPFAKIVIPFQIDGPVVTIDQARMTGGPLGLRVSGTIHRQTGVLNMSGQVTPLYPVNRLIGQIPIIGGLLGGSKGLGAINADFTLSGTLDDPKAKLAASSVLVPGVVKELLRLFEPR